MAFTIQRGVNISHWLSQSEQREAARAAWFAEQDVQYIAGLRGRGRFEIRAAAHGADACLMGAVALVLDAFLEDPILTR